MNIYLLNLINQKVGTKYNIIDMGLNQKRNLYLGIYTAVKRAQMLFYT